MSRSLALVAAFSAFSGLVGCATAHAPSAHRMRPVELQTARLAGDDASGTWDWMFRSQDDQGDERIEQEEWHLVQRNGRIEGYYDRRVTMLSVDERLFKCNQKLGFTKETHVRIAGQVASGRVVLREVDFEAKPGPCDDGARNLVEYSGTVHGEKLALQWAPQAGQTLIRREGGAPLAPLVRTAEFTGESGGAQNASMNVSAELGGTWEWELRSIDAEGDERLEREEWHLTETADGIRGYYDRTVKRVRGEGTFTCEGQSFERIQTATRYTVVGQRFGNKFMLTETDFKADRAPCDNAKRRLDKYNGQVSDADSLILSWGPGNQLLRRKR